MTTLGQLSSDLYGHLWFVGGCVRDKLLGLKPKDVDVVAVCHPFVLEDALNRLGVRHDTVGKSFGVTKAHFSDYGTVDLALPRREVSTGPGHKEFTVEAGPQVPLEDDAKRRDFTVNAIFENVDTGQIQDPLGGKEDLEKHILKVTSESSFKDDPLRLLRAVQFSARFGLFIEAHTYQLMEGSANLINTIPVERIAMELGKLMLAERPSIGLNIMIGLPEIMHYIFPELMRLSRLYQPAKFHNADALDHTLRVTDAVRPDINMRFAALFHDLGKASTYSEEQGKITFHGHEREGVKLANEIIDRLKLFTITGFDREFICTLIDNHMFSMDDKQSNPPMRRLIRKVGGIERFHDLIQLRIADKIGGARPYTIWQQLEFLRDGLEAFKNTSAPSPRDLAVDGKDVMAALGIGPGPAVGEALRKLFEMVENDEMPNEKEAQLAWLKSNRAQ